MGDTVGNDEGKAVGNDEGGFVVEAAEGRAEGTIDTGVLVGEAVCAAVGVVVGTVVGAKLGLAVTMGICIPGDLGSEGARTDMSTVSIEVQSFLSKPGGSEFGFRHQ